MPNFSDANSPYTVATTTPDLPNTHSLNAATFYAALLQQLQAVVAARQWCVIGIHSGGAWLAQRLAQDLKLPAPGTLDISFYRDDFSRIGLHPQVRPSAIPFDIENRNVLLVDDVLLTGRTVRAAMNALFDYGRPACIELAVLVDRVALTETPGSVRELPIAPTYCGARVALAAHQHVVLSRHDEQFQLALEQK